MTTRRKRSNEENTRKARISAMKQRLEKMADGHMVFWESDAVSDEHMEEFLRRVIAFEEGPFTTDFDRLIHAGIELPDPASMDDEALKAKLCEVIGGLARMRVFISHTDHLSDRELYAQLWTESLRTDVPVGLPDDDGASHLDLLMGGSAEETHLYLKFYADEKQRQAWLESFPDDVLPSHEELPYDRDRHLPHPYEEVEEPN